MSVHLACKRGLLELVCLVLKILKNRVLLLQVVNNCGKRSPRSKTASVVGMWACHVLAR